MAKVNRLILEYTELLKDVDFEIDGKVRPSGKLIKKFIKMVSNDLDDPRYEKMCTYPIETIIVTAFFGILGNCTNFVQIADFTATHRDYFSKFIFFPENRTPIDDTYRRVFSLISHDELSKITSKYVMSIFREMTKYIKTIKEKYNLDDDKFLSLNGKQLINIDGKVGRGTGRYYKNNDMETIKNLETLNVYNASLGVCLFSIPIKDKTNEIPVAQDIMSKMNLKNTIVTLDAIHAQHKTFKVIADQGGDYVICLKENQKNIYKEIENYLAKNPLNNFKESRVFTSSDKRKFYQIPFLDLGIEIDQNKDIPEWISCRSIIVYINKKTTRYFVTSLINLEEISQAIIGRWDVENLLHRYLDMVFDEDDNKCMDVNAFTNFSILNKLALSLMKLVKPMHQNKSLIRMKKIYSYDPIKFIFFMLEYISLDTFEQIIKGSLDENVTKIKIKQAKDAK